jgi:TatD DNase family protein
MIDTHCHLTDRRLLPNVAAALDRCVTHGVLKVITIATTPGDAEDARALADRHEVVSFAAGIHPNESGKFTPEDVPQLREFMAHPKCVALGEIGLDLHWKDVPLAHQEGMFRAQLGLARELGKPVVIHAREAIPQTLAVMAEFPEVRAVFHCFTGTAEEAHHVFKAGHYMGFDGPLTYRKNEVLRYVAASAPADRVLVETDAPYLSPEPHRSVKVNEPMYVRYVLEALAIARNITVAQADALTTRNANALFGA